jgi:hypothetical protein
MVMVDRQAEGVCFVFMVVVLLRLAAFDLNRLKLWRESEIEWAIDDNGVFALF